MANDEWGTPEWILSFAREVLGHIELDPFSSAEHNERVCADRWLDDSDRSWRKASGEPSRVWANPPYSKGRISDAVNRWIAAADDGEMASGLILTNVDTSTCWCQALMEYDNVFLSRRVSFVDRTDGKEVRGNRHASMITYAGTRAPLFRSLAGYHGMVMP